MSSRFYLAMNFHFSSRMMNKTEVKKGGENKTSTANYSSCLIINIKKESLNKNPIHVGKFFMVECVAKGERKSLRNKILQGRSFHCQPSPDNDFHPHSF